MGRLAEGDFPDPQTLHTVLESATRAPSVHNSQPWRWLVGPDSLYLLADPSRQLPHTDPDGRNLMLSCGAALHHCTVALAAGGWHAKVQRLPDPQSPEHLATIEVTPKPADELDVMLCLAIGRRRTDRRSYRSWPVPWGDIALMGARAARAGVMLRQVDEIPRLRDIVLESVARHASDADYLAELTAWSGRYGSVAGVPARNTPAPEPSAPIPVRAFAGPALRDGARDASEPEGSVVVALGTENDDDLARLRAGEATSLVLLSATAMGLASCPVTEPLEIPETREAVRADVFGDSGYPQMMVRVGWPPVDAGSLPPTPRRPVPDVAEWRLAGASAS
ncbi:MAG TPA: NAD(P)H nitroreductase [Mycobacterium sp.]|nr:NAD(P)H nitroreductase [Mycobacterium sp.]